MVKPRENRLHMMLSEEELTAIDDWRFKNRVATRSEAIRRLCQLAFILDGRSEGLLAMRMSAMEAMTELSGAIIKSGASTGATDVNEKLFASSASMWRSMRGQNTGEPPEPLPLEEAYKKCVSAIADLDRSIKEILDAEWHIKSPSKIEQIFIDLDVSTELYNRMLGRPTEKSHMTMEEIFEEAKTKLSQKFPE